MQEALYLLLAFVGGAAAMYGLLIFTGKNIVDQAKNEANQLKETGKVSRWYLPGSHSLNFLLENALGGGGVASLRIDPQGKAFAQQLLEFPIPIPGALAETL